MWWRIIWSLMPWWGWVGVVMMVMTTVGALTWFWFDLTCSAFSGRGFRLVLILAAVGGILVAVGMQREQPPLQIVVRLPSVQPKPVGNRIGALRWLWQQYRDATGG